MDHVTNIYGVFKKADMHLGASCLSSFCLLYHHHIAHVLCIALNFFLPVATYGHRPSNLHSFEGFNNHILFLCRRRVQKLLGAVSVLSGHCTLGQSERPNQVSSPMLYFCTSLKEMEGIPRNYEFVLCWSVVCRKLLPRDASLLLLLFFFLSAGLLRQRGGVKRK